MAIDDLSDLRQELPDLFDDQRLPSTWEDDWTIVRVDDPEGARPEDFEMIFADEMDRTGIADGPRTSEIIVPDFGSSRFPGSPTSYNSQAYAPPPDCLAFYLPFHHFNPTWWGIYLIVEGIQWLARFICTHSSGALTLPESFVSARIFAYGHESFHHLVESFATRLEITHRVPLYRTGFDRLYRSQVNAQNSTEEALASAHGYSKVQGRAFRRPRNTVKERAALAALGAYIKASPPGYNQALNFIRRSAFASSRSDFAEDNHSFALPAIPRRGARAWHSFPHAFSGMSRVYSRVNYAIRAGSPLATRIRTRYYLRYPEVAQRLRKLAGCTMVRQAGGHEIWQNPHGHRFPVPRHPGDLRPGTLQKIIRQAGLQLSLQEFASRAP